MQINQGPAFFENKLYHLENIVEIHHPHVIALSEANLKKSEFKNTFFNGDFKFELTKCQIILIFHVTY